MTSPQHPDSYYVQADGTNGVISYTGSQAYRVRVKKIEYDWEVIFTESHARAHRAMYPHQRAVARFALTLEFKGYVEYRNFVTFMWGYISSFVNANQYSMFVNVPVRNFLRFGIPVGGLANTDHVGSMVFSPRIIFEAMEDPADPVMMSGSSNSVSQPDTSAAGSTEKDFFYPFSAASQIASLTAETLYDTPSTTGGGINDVINNATGQTPQSPFLPGTAGTGGSTAIPGTSGIPGSPF